MTPPCTQRRRVKKEKPTRDKPPQYVMESRSRTAETKLLIGRLRRLTELVFAFLAKLLVVSGRYPEVVANLVDFTVDVNSLSGLATASDTSPVPSPGLAQLGLT